MEDGGYYTCMGMCVIRLTQDHVLSSRIYEISLNFNSFCINFAAKKSKASIEIIVKAQPDRHKENEVWYNGESGKGNVDNHVDNDFIDNGTKTFLKNLLTKSSFNLEFWILVSSHLLITFFLIDPLRKINSYNHGLTNDRNSNNNDYHYKNSYEYEPQNTNNGFNDWRGEFIKIVKKV